MSWELPDVQATCRKGRETRDQISNIHCAIEKVRGWRQTPAFASLTQLKPFCFPVLSRSVTASLCEPAVRGGSPGKDTGLDCHVLLRVFPIQRLNQVSCIAGGFITIWATWEAFDCGSQQTVENSSRDGNTRPPDLPPEKPVCWSRNNT